VLRTLYSWAVCRPPLRISNAHPTGNLDARRAISLRPSVAPAVVLRTDNGWAARRPPLRTSKAHQQRRKESAAAPMQKERAMNEEYGSAALSTHPPLPPSNSPCPPLPGI